MAKQAFPFLLVALGSLPGFAATIHYQNIPGGTTSGHAFERLLRNIDINTQAECMRGESFKQVINGKSSIRKVGEMPDGYFYGMLMSFAKNVCRTQAGTSGNYRSSFEGILSRPADASISNDDTLKKYSSNSVLRGQSPLTQNYLLLLHLGMIESSGNYRDGIDQSASNTDGITTEAGLFQVSFNSVNGSMVNPGIYQSLLSEYSGGKDPQKCMNSIFKNPNVSKEVKESYGTGASFQFQEAMKNCPAMAVDYMAVLARTTYRHNGPLKRGYAKPRESCAQILSQMESQLRSSQELCSGVEALTPSDLDFSSELFSRSSQVKGKKLPPIDRGSMNYNTDTGEVIWIEPNASQESSKIWDPFEGISEDDRELEVHKANTDFYNDLKKQQQALPPESKKQSQEIDEILKDESLQDSVKIQNQVEKLEQIKKEKTKENAPSEKIEKEIEQQKKTVEQLVAANKGKKKSKKAKTSGGSGGGIKPLTRVY